MKNLELYPALCGKAFTVHWLPLEAEPVEWPCQLRYYAMYARKLGVGSQGKGQVMVTWLGRDRNFVGMRGSFLQGIPGLLGLFGCTVCK